MSSFCQLKKKSQVFGNFFDIQMAIFRRVRYQLDIPDAWGGVGKWVYDT